MRRACAAARSSGRACRPRVYSDELVKALFLAKAVTGLSLRALEGFARGLRELVKGEWKVRTHGTDGKRRTWKKIHILVDRETGHVTAVEMTENSVNDCLVLPALLPARLDGDALLDDGAYHTKKAHRAVHDKGGLLLMPPKVGARR